MNADKNNGAEEYSIYKFSGKELVSHIGIVFVCILVVSKLFYNSYVAVLFMLPLYFPITKMRKKALCEKRKKEFKRQFNDAIVSLSDAMNVGYSVENAVKEAYKETETLYGKDSYICKELLEVGRKISVNTPIEVAFVELAKRVEIKEVLLFSQIFSIAKRAGGNMTALISMVSENIRESFRVEEEIYVAISEKRLEQKIMSLVPIGIIVYVSITSPGFLDVMYTTILGRIIMTASLIIYGGAIYVAERIMQVDI